MIQHSQDTARNAEEFYDVCEAVSPEVFGENRAKNGNFTDAVKRSNQMMVTAWEGRENNPVPWIHNSMRWRLLHLGMSDYVAAANLTGNFVLKTLENPEIKRDLRIHESAHASVAYLASIQDTSWSRNIRETLRVGREKLLQALIAPYELQTEKLLLTERVTFGPQAFDEKTAGATQRLRPRIIKGRVTPFEELVKVMRGLHFADKEEMATNCESVWRHACIQNALNAYIADQISQGIPEPVAQIMAIVEFSGHSFTTNDLKSLGMSQNTRRALTNKRMVPVDRLEGLRAMFVQTIGSEATDGYFQMWNHESQKLKRETNFSKQIRAAIDTQNIQPEMILPVFGINPSECTGHEVMRSALERGPSKKMPLLSLIHILATSDQELTKYERRARSDLCSRWSANRTQASFRLPAELQLCGLEIEDLGLSDDDKDEFAELQRGVKSKLREPELLREMRKISLSKNVIPVMEKWVASQEPDSVSRMFELLAMRRSHGLRALVQGSKTSEATVNAIRKNELLPQHSMLKDFCGAAGVCLPTGIEIQALAQTADAEAASGILPLGRAANALISRSHRHQKTFRRDREVDISDRTFATYLTEAAECSQTNPKLIAELCAKADSEDRDALQKYVSLLNEGKTTEVGAIIRWLDAMTTEGKSGYVDGFIRLQEILKRRSLGDKEEAATTEERLVVLRQRNYKLHRWKYGKQNIETGTTQDLSAPHEKQALKTLSMLPGATSEAILAVSLVDRNEELRRHIDRIVSITDLSSTDAIVNEIALQLLQGTDRILRSAIYGDDSKPGSPDRISVLRKRDDLKIVSMHFSEDRKRNRGSS